MIFSNWNWKKFKKENWFWKANKKWNVFEKVEVENENLKIKAKKLVCEKKCLSWNEGMKFNFVKLDFGNTSWETLFWNIIKLKLKKKCLKLKIILVWKLHFIYWNWKLKKIENLKTFQAKQIEQHNVNNVQRNLTFKSSK